MSILINGMDMPKDCAGCCLSIYYDGYNGGYGYCTPGYRCRLLKRLIEEDRKKRDYYPRPSDCPLVEVPTPHGNLIDRDDILDILDKIIFKPDSYGQRCMAMATKEILINQPTIIEAEGKS